LAAAGLGALGLAAWAALAPMSAARPASTDDEYAPPETCAVCHRSVWETYRKTGMGRSFYRPAPENTPVGDGSTAIYYHKASDSYFAMYRRGGSYYQRRHQLDSDGRPVNVMEKRVDYIMGSGNHARAYLHRTARNTLIELPLAWYAEKGGFWAMNPGYDRADHEGFRRKIAYDCMFCHNGYPRIPAASERPLAEAAYVEPLPLGIDCQRCHGPGRRHATLARTAGTKAEAIRGAIVNPARLSPELREEVCIQCHLETTSFPLPNSLQRYDQGPFAYRPGQPLAAHWLFFDHAPGAGREDKFEIVNAVYRLRRSRCYVETKGGVLCVACHNPHDAPRGEAATRQYDAACRRCHGAAFERAVTEGRHVRASGCADCHMPKRRTEDVVHSLATDHFIQRRKPVGDLRAERAERHETGADAYRGEVVLYYPRSLPATTENELYLALAQTIDNSNLDGGISRLSAALERHASARAEFYLGLAEAWRNSGQMAKALPLYREAARRDPKSVFLLVKLATALRRAGETAEAIEALRKASVMAADDASVWRELGLAYRAQGRLADAMEATRKAIALDPDMPEPHNNLAIVLLSEGEKARAAAEFLEAIRIQPDYADAHNNLANLMAGSGDFPGALRHFEIALRLRPDDATARYNFAMALGRARQFEEAQRQLEAALRVDANLADAHLLLADLLMAKGQPREAAPHYREAVRLLPESSRARLELGTALAMLGDTAGAVPHLRRAAADPATRARASEILRRLGQ
jgi:predicted CXXCH cytochrome family protein